MFDFKEIMKAEKRSRILKSLNYLLQDKSNESKCITITISQSSLSKLVLLLVDSNGLRLIRYLSTGSHHYSHPHDPHTYTPNTHDNTRRNKYAYTKLKVRI